MEGDGERGNQIRRKECKKVNKQFIKVGVRSGVSARLTPSKGKGVIFVTKQNSILSNKTFDVKFQQDREKVTGIIPGERREPE